MVSPMLEVVRIPVLSDNYVWLLHDPRSQETVVIDPAVAEPVLKAAAARGWTIGQIWNTHWHGDHVGGNAAIKAATGCIITGPAAEAEKIATLDRLVGERLFDEGSILTRQSSHFLPHRAAHARRGARDLRVC